MKTNCWIGPLIAVILLLTLKQSMYELQSEEQRVVIPVKNEVIKKVLRSEIKEKEAFVKTGDRLRN